MATTPMFSCVVAICACVVVAATFETSPNMTYDPEEAKMFASLASASYCASRDAVQNWTCSSCKDSKTPLVPGKIRLVDGGDFHKMQILIGKLRDQDGCVMSFRGSDNVLNWIRDFQVWRIDPSAFGECAGCKVHSGFYQIWKNVEDLALKTLAEVGCSTADGKDNMLYITGHSLGAALTHLAMFSLDDAGFKIGKSYSFEAPRVGNKAFAEAFSDRFERRFPVFRITHHEDPVVHLPPTVLGYEHVQKEVYYDAKGNYQVCAKVEDGSCADQFWDIPGMVLLHSGEHCASPLVPDGNICDCYDHPGTVIV